MQIDWWTLALQAVNFLVLVWLLGRFLYRPVKEVIEKRKEIAEQAFAEAEKQGSEAEAARQRFEAGQAGLVQERQDMLKKVHEDLEAERRKISDEARHEADELLKGARASIAQEREAALKDIREQVATLAVDLALAILRKSGSNASVRFVLESLERQLDELPANERERLDRDLAEDNARLTVVTATPMTPQERDQWSDRLNTRFGQKDKTDFATDPKILDGAELRLPHAVMKFTWRDQLQKAKELLREDELASPGD